MGRKKEMSADQLRALMALVMKEANRPLEDSELPDELLNFDFEDFPASPGTTGITIPTKDVLPPCGTHPICIRVPVSTLRAFKAKAVRTGASYQTLMIRSLRAAAALV